MKNLKLTTITRRDLPDGVQSVQSSHAAINFIMKYPADSREWFTSSNYLAQLSCENESELEKIAVEAEKRGIKVVRFLEPDIGNQLTAICLEPGRETRRLTSSYPLMLKQPKLEVVAA